MNDIEKAIAEIEEHIKDRSVGWPILESDCRFLVRLARKSREQLGWMLDTHKADDVTPKLRQCLDVEALAFAEGGEK
jgi:hypothetical protein